MIRQSLRPPHPPPQAQNCMATPEWSSYKKTRQGTHHSLLAFHSARGVGVQSLPWPRPALPGHRKRLIWLLMAQPARTPGQLQQALASAPCPAHDTASDALRPLRSSASAAAPQALPARRRLRPHRRRRRPPCCAPGARCEASAPRASGTPGTCCCAAAAPATRQRGAQIRRKSIDHIKRRRRAAAALHILQAGPQQHTLRHTRHIHASTAPLRVRAGFE